MKKIFLALAAGLMLLAGCETDNMHAEYKGNGGVAFRAATLVVTQVATGNNVVEIPIDRANADGALTVDLKFNRPADAKYPADIISIPASATFADGQYTTSFPVTVNVPVMTPGVNYSLPITATNPTTGRVVYDDKDNASTTTSVNFQCTTPPEWLPEIKVMKYIPGAFNAAFGLGEVWYAKYQKANGYNIYRLIDAYQPQVEYEGFMLGSEYFADSEMKTRNNLLEINALDPANVIIVKQSLGVDWDYGGIFALNGTAGGKMVDGVMTVPCRLNVDGDSLGANGVDVFDFNTQTP